MQRDSFFQTISFPRFPNLLVGFLLTLSFSVGAFDRISFPLLSEVANGDSRLPSVSADGTRIAFESVSSKLVPNDTNGLVDMFVYDRTTDTITRVSVDSNGNQSVGGNVFGGGAISADGRYVVFISRATNLVSGDNNEDPDVFVHDLETGITTRESVGTGGFEVLHSQIIGCSISGDGRYIAFSSNASTLGPYPDSAGHYDIYYRDRLANTTTLISESWNAMQNGNGSCYYPSISADGRYVAFESGASDLVASDTNDVNDSFLYDKQSGTMIRVGERAANGDPNSGTYGAVISPDGEYVLTNSFSTNLVPGDISPVVSILRHSVRDGSTTRITVDEQGMPVGGSHSRFSASQDGRFVLFSSSLDGIVSSDSNGFQDVFLRDVKKGRTRLISRTSDGQSLSQDASFPFLSANGEWIAYSTPDGGVDPPDFDGFADVYLGMNPILVEERAARAAARAALNRKIQKLKKKAKKIKRKGRRTAAKRILKKVKKLKQKLRRI